MGMRQYRPHRETRTATRALLIAAFLSLGICNSAEAQDSTGPELQPTGEVRQATVGTPRVVTLKNLPQARLQIRTAQPVGAQGASLPEPHGGLRDVEWKALKAQAAKLPDPNGATAGGAALAPSPSPQTGNADTPDAFIRFVAQDEDLSCSGGSTSSGLLAPSDVALAVGQTQVVQAVNDCIAVYDKTTSALLEGYPKSLNEFLTFLPNSCPPGSIPLCPRLLFYPRAMSIPMPRSLRQSSAGLWAHPSIRDPPS